MANRSYLCCSDLDRLYPSLSTGQYDPHKNTVAEDVYGVPLMWLAMFRQSNLRTEMLAVDGEQVEAWGAIAPTEVALQQLAISLPVLNRMLSPNRLDDHAAMLRQAILAVGGRFVTIEWEEIDLLQEKGIFRKKVDSALDYWTKDSSVTRLFPLASSGRHALLEISRVNPKHAMPAPTSGFWDRPAIPNDEMVNLCRLLGTAWVRPVPWESNVPVRQTPDGIARSEQVKAQAKQEIQERLAREAQRDSLITDHVCPKCGKPCPTYRKTCKHCGFKVAGG